MKWKELNYKTIDEFAYKAHGRKLRWGSWREDQYVIFSELIDQCHFRSKGNHNVVGTIWYIPDVNKTTTVGYWLVDVVKIYLTKE